jgi:hypothetical protein
MAKKTASKGNAHGNKRKVKSAAGKASERIDAFISGLAPPLRDIAKALRKAIRDSDQRLVETVKWSWPCYTADGQNICGFIPLKDTVNFVLFRGADLSDPNHLIEGTGHSVRHVKLQSVKDVRRQQFKWFIKQSIGLNREELASG